MTGQTILCPGQYKLSPQDPEGPLSSLHHNAMSQDVAKSYLSLLSSDLTRSGAHQLNPSLYSEG